MLTFIMNVKKQLGFKGKHYDPYYIKLLNNLITKNTFDSEQQQLLIDFTKEAEKQKSLNINTIINAMIKTKKV